MKEFNCNAQIKILGTTFYGIQDIIKHARSHKAKNGIFVGEDSKLYPCFDFEDFINEDRYYMNFVFSTDLEELEIKLSKLSQMKHVRADYNKLDQSFHPMIYWAGEDRYLLQMTEEQTSTD